MSLYRRAGVRVARVPPHLDLCPHRPDQKAADLKGRKVGVPEYQLTANVWARAFLEDDYGVKRSDIHWIRGGIEQAGRPEKITVKLPPGVRLENVPEGKTISALLEAGEIDGFMAPRPPTFERGHPHIGWLFPDPMAAAKDYYSAPASSRSCTSSACGAQSSSTIPGCRPRCSRPSSRPRICGGTARRNLIHQSHAAVRRGAGRGGARPDGPRLLVLRRRGEPQSLDYFLAQHHKQGLSSRLVKVEELFHPTTFETYKL